jgi:hypothetical protein
MERREFLVGCSAAVVATATEQPRAMLTALDGVAASVLKLGRDTFRALVGREFRAYDQRGRFQARMRLAAVEDAAVCCDAVDQFTLVWEGAAGLSEDLYYLTDKTSAAFTMHISPVSVDESRYRAAFSLMKSRS